MLVLVVVLVVVNDILLAPIHFLEGKNVVVSNEDFGDSNSTVLV